MASVEVVVPWRGGCPHREAALAWVTGRYADSGFTNRITIASCPPGPWVKAAAVTPTVEASTADIIVVADADVWTSRLGDAIDAVASGRARWATPHERVRRLDPLATLLVLEGAADIDDPVLPLAEPAHLAAVGGVIVLTRDTYLDVPLDHRFEGWGQEDHAWGLALHALAGKPWRSPASLGHLWHPPQPRRSRPVGSAEGLERLNQYRRARHDPAAIRALVEERRR